MFHEVSTVPSVAGLTVLCSLHIFMALKRSRWELQEVAHFPLGGQGAVSFMPHGCFTLSQEAHRIPLFYG